jgi:hypothetical protein
VEERQEALFEVLGIAGSFGVSQLATIQSRFNNDEEVMQALGALVRGCDLHCCTFRKFKPTITGCAAQVLSSQSAIVLQAECMC